MAAPSRHTWSAARVASSPGASIDNVINISDDDVSSDYYSEEESQVEQRDDGFHDTASWANDASARAIPRGDNSTSADGSDEVLHAGPLLSTLESRITLDASASNNLLGAVASSDQQNLIGLGIVFPVASESSASTHDGSPELESTASIVTPATGRNVHDGLQRHNSKFAHSMNDVLCSGRRPSVPARNISLKGSAVDPLLRGTAPDGQMGPGGLAVTVPSSSASPTGPSISVEPVPSTPFTGASPSFSDQGSIISSFMKKHYSGNPGLGNSILFSPRHVPASSNLRNSFLSAPRRSIGTASSTSRRAQSNLRNSTSLSSAINAPSLVAPENVDNVRPFKRQKVALSPEQSPDLLFNFGANLETAPLSSPGKALGILSRPSSANTSLNKSSAINRASATPIMPNAVNRAGLKRKASASPPVSSSSARFDAVKAVKLSKPTPPVKEPEWTKQNTKSLTSLDTSPPYPLLAAQEIKPAPKRQRRQAAIRAETANRVLLKQFDNVFNEAEYELGRTEADTVPIALPKANQKTQAKAPSRPITPERQMIGYDSSSSPLSPEYESEKAGWRRRVSSPTMTADEHIAWMLKSPKDHLLPRLKQHATSSSANATKDAKSVATGVDMQYSEHTAQVHGANYNTREQSARGFATPEMVAEETEDYGSGPDTVMSPTVVRNIDERIVGPTNNGQDEWTPSLGIRIQLTGDLSVSGRSNALLDIFNAGEMGRENSEFDEEQPAKLNESSDSDDEYIDIDDIATNEDPVLGEDIEIPHQDSENTAVPSISRNHLNDRDQARVIHKTVNYHVAEGVDMDSLLTRSTNNTRHETEDEGVDTQPAQVTPVNSSGAIEIMTRVQVDMSKISDEAKAIMGYAIERSVINKRPVMAKRPVATKQPLVIKKPVVEKQSARPKQPGRLEYRVTSASTNAIDRAIAAARADLGVEARDELINTNAVLGSLEEESSFGPVVGTRTESQAEDDVAAQELEAYRQYVYLPKQKRVQRGRAAQLVAYEKAEQQLETLDDDDDKDDNDGDDEAKSESDSDSDSEGENGEDGKNSEYGENEETTKFDPVNSSRLTHPITAQHTPNPPTSILKTTAKTPTPSKRVHFLKWNYLVNHSITNLNRYNEQKFSGLELSLRFTRVHAFFSSPTLTPTTLRNALEYFKGLLEMLLGHLRGFVKDAEGMDDGDVERKKLRVRRQQVDLVVQSLGFVERRIMDCERLIPRA